MHFGICIFVLQISNRDNDWVSSEDQHITVHVELIDILLIYRSIVVLQISNPDSDMVSSEDQHITVHVEWIDSQLLIYPTYHRLDDVARVHKQQMM